MEWIRQRFPHILLVFILVQPIVDLLTSLTISLFQTEATAGLFFRMGIMVLSALYLVLAPSNQFKRPAILYLGALGVAFAATLAVNFTAKPVFHLFTEVKYLAKLAYFPVMLLTYLVALQYLRQTQGWDEKVRKYIYYSMAVSSLSIIIAMLTGTEFAAYRTHFKQGTSGWFFSGNEVSAIAATTFPVMVLYALNRTRSIRDLIYYVPIAVSAFVLMAMGTKVGYFAGLLTLMILAGGSLFAWIQTRPDHAKRIQAFVASGAFILFVLSTPFAPIAGNTQVHLKWIEEKKLVDGKKPDPRVQNEVANLLLSSRDVYLKQHREFYQQATGLQKAFGMGYAGLYTKQPKMIEMDFHDLFYSLGLVGAVTYLLPLLWLAYAILRRVLRNLRAAFQLETMAVAVGVLLGFGIAFLAGHVITAPAVSIYLAVLLPYLYYKFQTEA